ncbi:MAG: cyclic nucleotide-binding domain-containing protein [Leptospiraceae bacterium]|nr:cyclic nucleotide-binding domain-containing protein [Leptospiraceae bacterium]
MDNPLFKLVNFSQGSYIILEGERKSPNFFIVKDGRVLVKRDFPVPGEKPSEVMNPGDFFGVVAAMSQYPQIESAVAQTNVTLIAVSYNRFGELIQKNAPLAMKIIRSFSKKLRDMDKAQTGSKNPPSNTSSDLNILFNMAENYFNQGNIDSAVYLYQSYIKYQPEGEYIAQAKKKLKTLGRPEVGETTEGTNRSYQTGQMIFFEGEPGNDLFIVQKGKIKISKIINGNEVILNIMKTGDIFGEMALLDNKPRSASATASEDVDLLAINKTNFETMTVSQPQLMSKIITLLSERIWNAYKKIANSYLPDINARMADMLMTMAERNRVKIGPREFHDFKIGAVEFLQMLGLTDRDTGTILKFVTSNKFIRIDNDTIVCSDMALLDRMVHQMREKLKG